MKALPFIAREITSEIRRLGKAYPVLTLTGPRQSGKTTLCKRIFPRFAYFNLEDAGTRRLVEADPRAFLEAHASGGVIVDEAQRLPELFSAAQVVVDEKPSRRIVFTGSCNFLLMKSISQSLAGRTAVLKLPPLSLQELGKTRVAAPKEELIFNGGYPRVWSGVLPPGDVFSDYYETYVERDLRRLEELRHLTAFKNFMRLCAGSVGCEFNASAFANSVGVSLPTIQAWTSVLEASYIVFRLPPFFRNVRKRIVKRPKLYFCDTGLACWLIGAENAAQLETHPLRGNLFENLVIAEFYKRAFARHDNAPRLFYYRDSTQNEVDLIEERAGRLDAYEIKSASDFRENFTRGLDYFRNLFGAEVASTRVIYDGRVELDTSKNGVVNFRNL